MYGRSKLANILFAKELARRFERQGAKRVAFSCHPGVIATSMPASIAYALTLCGACGAGLSRHFAPPGGSGTSPPLFPTDKSTEQGAATQVYLATSPAALEHSGAYFKDCAPARARKLADDVGLAQRLWVESERIVSRL